jgi:hypothetical protein|tara:strand:+ start:9115 stop:9513 length:399 start_codon:yes stop_codon:yes gene_type:complete
MKELRGKLIPVTAKKRINGIFEIGDELTVQAVLYSKPKLLVNALCGAFNGKDELLGMGVCPPELIDKPIGTKLMMDSKWNNGQYLVKMYEPLYAGVGTYHYSVIILVDGTEFGDSILGPRTLDYTFDKISLN